MDQSKEYFNEQESLKVIHEMIDKAKKDLGSQAFYPILWGWVVLIGSIGHYVLLEYIAFGRAWLAWLVIFIGIIGSIVKGINSSKKSGAANYTSSIVAMIWVIFLVNYFILLPFLDVINYMITPLVLLMTGGSIVLTGFATKFKPFYYSGIFVWLMTIAAFLLPRSPQLLICAATALFGILIPGYILKIKENQ